MTFDLTNKESFKNGMNSGIEYWMREFENNSGNSDVIIILVGNKKDLE